VKDSFGRTIDYVRISVTDRCDLRCVYCMPEEGIPWTPHAEILRFEDILRIARVLASLGVTQFRLTGGEPLVRRGIASLAAGLKEIDGVERVALTTNGVTLAEHLPALLRAGLDAVNVSIDTLDRMRYRAITRRDSLPDALRGLEAALAAPNLTVKLNCVILTGGEADWVALAALAKDRDLAVRFIERMPLGPEGAAAVGESRVCAALEAAYGPLAPCAGPGGSGPCRYFSLPGFRGTVGFISALSHKFCAGCNRVRLTSTGFLKTCLQFETGADLRPLLQGDDAALREAILAAVAAKPAEHRFTAPDIPSREQRPMSQIGG